MIGRDGHWHRRTDQPLKQTDTWRWFGCTREGCGWQVVVHRRTHEEHRFNPVWQLNSLPPVLEEEDVEV